MMVSVMANIKKGWILGIVVVLIVVAVVVIENPFKKERQATQDQFVPAGAGKQVGDNAIDLSFTTIEGDTLKLSDFKGKQALVVNAWAAWCPFCLAEIPDLQRGSDKFDDVTALFVHRTSTETQARAMDYLDDFLVKEGFEITDPVVLDPDDSFYASYFGFGMPVTVFIDKEGVIRDRKVGPLTMGEIEQRMEALS
jgi:peroxiredoxin